MSCDNNNFAGINANCEVYIELATAVILMKPGTSLTEAEAVKLANWETEVNENENAIVLELTNYENNTEDLTINTTALGKHVPTGQPVPRVTFYLATNPCDYNQLHLLNGQNYDVVFLTADGKIMYHKKNTNVNGFSGSLTTRPNAPYADGQENMYPLVISFKSVRQFMSYGVLTPDFEIEDLKSAVPVGLSLQKTEEYGDTASGDIAVEVKLRCTETGLEDLATADFEVVTSKAKDVEVTAVTDNGHGLYDLTIQKNVGSTPADLASGDNTVIRVKKLDASAITHVSGTLKIVP